MTTMTNDPMGELARELARDLRPSWRVKPGIYRCPVCASPNAARVRTVTTYYPERTESVERTIRCVDCGEDSTEEWRLAH